MNCRKKDELSLLRKAGGNGAYGEFHVLQELWLEMQQHRPQPQNWFTINQATLLRELGINARSLPNRIELYSKTCGIQFEKITKTIANVSYINWKITLPKSLIFIDPSRLKSVAIGKGIGKGIGIAAEIPAPLAPVPTPPKTPPAKEPKAAKRKTTFEDSAVHDMAKFVAACPGDWKFDEMKYWHGQAVQASNKGHKYINWITAVKGWRRDKPEQFKQWKARQGSGGNGGGPWGASKTQCGVEVVREGVRYGCQLKKGHDGPHEFEELYSGTGVRPSGPARIDKGPQRLNTVLDCEGLNVKPGEEARGKTDVSHETGGGNGI